MEKERIVKTEIKIEGIADHGYGLSYQYINRNKELTIESKGIYNYLSSLAGNGTEAFPSVSLMLSELGISKTRFYKHRELLLAEGLIRVEQGRAKYNKSGKVSYDTSLYVLLTDYDKIEDQKQRYIKEKNTKSNVETSNVKQRKKERVNNVKHIENKGFDVCPQNSDTRNYDTRNKDNNNNSLNNNNFNNNNKTTTIEKNTKANSSSSVSEEVKNYKITLAIKPVTKMNIKRKKLTVEQLELLEQYVLLQDNIDNLDSFSCYIAQEIKEGNITEKDLVAAKTVKKAKSKANIQSKLINRADIAEEYAAIEEEFLNISAGTDYENEDLPF